MNAANGGPFDTVTVMLVVAVRPTESVTVAVSVCVPSASVVVSQGQMLACTPAIVCVLKTVPSIFVTKVLDEPTAPSTHTSMARVPLTT